LQEFAFSLALLLTALLPFRVNHAAGKTQLLGGGEGGGKGRCLADDACSLISLLRAAPPPSGSAYEAALAPCEPQWRSPKY